MCKYCDDMPNIYADCQNRIKECNVSVGPLGDIYSDLCLIAGKSLVHNKLGWSVWLNEAEFIEETVDISYCPFCGRKLE